MAGDVVVVAVVIVAFRFGGAEAGNESIVEFGTVERHTARGVVVAVAVVFALAIGAAADVNTVGTLCGGIS